MTRRAGTEILHFQHIAREVLLSRCLPSASPLAAGLKRVAKPYIVISIAGIGKRVCRHRPRPNFLHSQQVSTTKNHKYDRRSAMDNKPAQNIQDTFLNTVRKDKTPITIYLVSGVKLTGKIRSFDKYSVLLENNSQEQLIFKHAISTVVSNRSVLHEHRPTAVQTGLGPSPVPMPAPAPVAVDQR
jgi:host factor-I protein